MRLDSIITEYDDSLSGDSFIDPLGQLVIWSAYGQEIFRNRVNSVSNDVRNFTLNLLHHGVIRSLLLDEEVQVSDALALELGPKESLSFIHACLIHLENIFTYSMVDHPEQDGIDTQGILGGSKGRAVLDDGKSGRNPQLVFIDKPAGQLLVRQLGLGVSGRYKTPFVEMGFFDQSYRYFGQTAKDRWSAFERLLSGNTALDHCFAEARKHLINLLASAQNKAQVPPTMHLADIPLDLKQAYRSAFRTGAKVGSDTREFWLSVTGLNEGAAGAVLQILEKRLSESRSSEIAPEKLEPQSIVQDAVNLIDHDDTERQKLISIQLIEPLLAEVELLFQVARYKKVQSLAEIRDHWEGLERSDATLPRCAERIRNNPEVWTVLRGTGRHRLDRLLDLAKLKTLEEQLDALLNYHTAVMTQRGQLSWVELTRNGEIQNHGRTTSLPAKRERPLGTWVNSYYLHQFNYLVSGYYGGKQ